MLSITIPLVTGSGNIYETVRYAWRLSKERAEQTEYVLAVHHSLVIGVFIPDEWHVVKEDDSKWHVAESDNIPKIKKGRLFFDGREAPIEIQKLYMGKRMPEKKRGAANPVQYVG